MKPLLQTIGLATIAFAAWLPSASGQSNLVVKGLGYFENRKLDARLAFLNGVDPKEEAELDSALIEDSAFLLLEQLKRKGYLEPRLTGTFSVDGGTVRKVEWAAPYSIQLEIEFRAEHAVFRCQPGVLYHYDAVSVHGVDAIPTERLERFFIPGGVLINRKLARVFTHENFERRIGRLLQDLRSIGYRDAKTKDKEVSLDPDTGAVRASVSVEQGTLHRVGRIEVVETSADEPERARHFEPEDIAFTSDWEQDERQRLRNEAYAEGYPDARVTLRTIRKYSNENGDLVHDLRFRVNRKEKVTLSGVRFAGDGETRRSVLRRQTGLQSGQALDLIQAGEGRRKLMALGIFSEVRMDFEPPEGGQRDCVYSLVPGQRKELQLLAGWGSYEQARAGFQWKHRNPWGRAHRYEIGVKQSVKASDFGARYSVPRIFGTGLTAYLDSSYGFREELSYERETRGVSLGTSTFLAESGIKLNVEYGLFKEDADRADTIDFESRESATVASLSVQATYDRRNDILAPTAGYFLFARFKTASQFLGGNVDFQKLEVGGSGHFSITESTIVHLGLTHGTLVSSGDAADNIPFTERFFPGGENSVRGYRQGGASPVDSSGNEVGAETYLQGNLEFEQRLTSHFSAVAFLDWAAVSRNGQFDGRNDTLYSVGLGIRYHTIVGPVRLEYGHNPDPREGDPSGTLHFSIGFPF